MKGGPCSVNADTALCREYSCSLGQTGLLQTKCLVEVSPCGHGPAVLPPPCLGAAPCPVRLWGCMSHPASVLGLWVSLQGFAASVSLLAAEWSGWRGSPTASCTHVGQAGGRLGMIHSLGSFTSSSPTVSQMISVIFRALMGTMPVMDTIMSLW